MRNLTLFWSSQLLYLPMNHSALFFLLILLVKTAYSQSFQSQKGQFNGALTYSQLSFSEVYDNDGEAKPVGDVRHQALRLNMCYGLLKNTEIYFEVPFVSNSAQTSAGKKTLQHAGDMESGIRWNYQVSAKHLLGLELRQSLATGKRDPQNSLNTGYVDNHSGLWLFYRSGFSNKCWIHSDAGYVFHYNAFSDEFRASIAGRFHVYAPLYLEVKLEGRRPFENDEVLLNRYALGLYQNNSGFIAGSITLRILKENKPGFLMGISSPIKGQFTPTAAQWYAGLIWLLSPKVLE